MSRSRPFIDVERWADESESLEAVGGLSQTRHRHERKSLHAINAALASGRPLLVRGDPGTGKSQLARAAAKRLGRRFVWRVMDAQARVSDLFYTFDAVERLAQAQVAGALCAAGAQTADEVRAAIDERNFIRPGPLWWAFDATSAAEWTGALEQGATAGVEQPYVVLIDEIDKTDPSVPNGLLEVLGQGTFPVRSIATVSLRPEQQAQPLVVITTNNERELPPAFVRRCMVLQIELPQEEAKLVDWLVERGQTHFSELPAELLRDAAVLVSRDHGRAASLGVMPPGQAEYLDLLRALQRLTDDDPSRRALLQEIAEFALKKHPDQHRPGHEHGS